ncbi:putative ferric-chelate reductase 1 [Silurus meridionalis]|uniref:Reelin domain-containing protein n=1 Tax=Silurus meridionalis TaxID=175797 RepID=A0A8T0B4Z6_SILME|nr:putative ferric-chelate reductase 1 [Silurus meridionalis]KAF7700269.1 hypothetical protein HF521_003227 [Silurus meridionalis]
MRLFFLVLFEMYTLSSVHAYPDGSVASACNTMLPNHPSFEPQTTTALYRVTVNRVACRPGDMITVTLESVNSIKFEGFMLQALPTSGKGAQGSFMAGDARLVRLHNCFNIEKSTISHSGPNEITQLEVMWVAPPSPAPSNITFCATIVRNYTEFWTMVKSPPILLSNSPTLAVNCLMMLFNILIALGLFRSSSLTLL